MDSSRNGKDNTGIIVLILSVALGFGFMYLLQKVMNHFWYEPFTGGNYTDAPPMDLFGTYRNKEHPGRDLWMLHNQ